MTEENYMKKLADMQTQIKVNKPTCDTCQNKGCSFEHVLGACCNYYVPKESEVNLAIYNLTRACDYQRFAMGAAVKKATFVLVSIDELEMVLKEVERLKTECGSK